ncbi:MAG: nucleoside deaminase [Rhodocyclaceae bacterium]
MTQESDVAHMREAIAQAERASLAGSRPFGAVLADATGQRLYVARNDQLSGGDCTGHAEMNLVRQASADLGAPALVGATVYASGEPCAMCAGALYWAGVARIVYGAPLASIERILGGSSLGLPLRDALAHAQRSVRVDGPVLEDEARVALEAGAARLKNLP